MWSMTTVIAIMWWWVTPVCLEGLGGHVVLAVVDCHTQFILVDSDDEWAWTDKNFDVETCLDTVNVMNVKHDGRTYWALQY